MTHGKNALSVLMTFALLLSLAPVTAIPARADGPVGISLGLDGVAKDDTVWFGGYHRDSETGLVSFPFDWRVLSPPGDTTNAVSGGDDALLILKHELDHYGIVSDIISSNTIFREKGAGNAWAGSTAQVWCAGFYDGKYIERSAAYDANCWSAAEKAAIRATSVAEENDKYDDDDKVSYFYTFGKRHFFGAAPLEKEHFFFLSAREADTYFADDGDRATGFTLPWWLRSPDAADSAYAGCVEKEGCLSSSVEGYSYVYFNRCARPAFNVDPSAVLLSSAAVGGKAVSAEGALDAIAANSTGEWKLTLLDESRSAFTVTEAATGIKADPGDTVTLHFSGAVAAWWLLDKIDYVSALLCSDAGKPLYYGSVRVTAVGQNTASFTLPAGLPVGFYTLRVFNERKCGDKSSDLSSPFRDVRLTVGDPTAIPPAITKQPGNLSLTYGQSTYQKLTVEASTAEGHTISYQWYMGDSPDFSPGNHTMVKDQTDASCAVSGWMNVGNHYFKCVVTAARVDTGLTASVVSSAGVVTIAASVEGEVDNGRLFVTGTNTPADSLLIAAVYNKSGKLVNIGTVTVGNIGGYPYDTGLTVPGGCTGKLMLVNKLSFAPLGKAWSAQVP